MQFLILKLDTLQTKVNSETVFYGVAESVVILIFSVYNSRDLIKIVINISISVIMKQCSSTVLVKISLLSYSVLTYGHRYKNLPINRK